MKRMYLVLTVAALMATMIVFAAPAMADVEFNDNRADRIENRLEDLGFDEDIDELDELDNLGLVDLDGGDDVEVDVGFNDNGHFIVNIDV